MQRRVAVTGLGVLSPIGKDLPSFWRGALAGTCGITPITHFDAAAFSTRFAGEIKDFDPLTAFRNPKDARRCDRYTQLAFAATAQAIANSGADLSRYDPTRCAMIVGSGIGGLKTLEDQHSILLERGPHRTSPFMIPMMIANMASGLLAIEHNFQGPNFAIVTACATSTMCVGEGYKLIRSGDVDMVIAGGSEAAICPLGIGGFGALKAVSTRNDAPEKASRPFDRDRDGFVLGEGAGILVLEEFEAARARGAHIHGEIIGYSNSCDAHHMTAPAPNGAGAARAMLGALRDANVPPERIDYINAHGTSTPQGDICETQAIKTVFGPHASRVWINSTKSMIGHLLGAAGSVELAACLMSLQTGDVHPTINLENPDPECDLDYVPNTARHGNIRTILTNSFGFGGHNACLIAAKV